MEFQPIYSIFSPSAEEYSKEEVVPNPNRGEMTEGSKGGATELKTSSVAYSPFRGWNQVDSDGERGDPGIEPNSNVPKSDKNKKSEDDGMNSWSYNHWNSDDADNEDPGYGIGDYKACSPIQCKTPDGLDVPEEKVENVEGEALEEEEESDEYEKCLNIAVKSIHGIVETMDNEKIENEKKSKPNPFEHSSTSLETEAVFSFGYPIGRAIRPSSIYVPQIETNRAVENLLAVMKKMDEDKELK